MPLVEGISTTPVFFRLMVRPKFLAASEKQILRNNNDNGRGQNYIVASLGKP